MNDHKCCQYHIASIMHIKKSLIVVAAAWKILLDTKTSMTNKSSFKIRNMKLYGNQAGVHKIVLTAFNHNFLYKYIFSTPEQIFY